MTNIDVRKSYWAMVSGGKDSLFMLRYLLEHHDKYPLDGVVHLKLEIDFPFISDVVDSMRRLCEAVHVQFVEIKPRVSWYELYNRYGFPSRACRWCNEHYKLDGEMQLREYLKSRGYELICYIGYCANEKARANKERQKKKCYIYPLIDADIYEHDILEWAKMQPIFNNYYRFNDRCGCMFCPMASMSNHAYLLYYYPEQYERMIELATDTERALFEKLGRKVSVWQGNAKYDTEYRDKQIREKYLPKLMEALNNDKYR